MRHKTLTGEIAYTSKKPERLDQPRGREWFTFTRHHDGKVTIRARCEIEEPDPSVHRDIVYSLDEEGRPMDCHVRLVIGDRFMGSGWFRFGPDFAECESYGPSIGRVSQRVALDRPLDGFGTHPIVGDGYLLHVQRGWKAGETRRLNLYLPSPDHRGATPPFLSPVQMDAVYVDDETVTVPAGTFAARHFRYVDDGTSGMAGAHPPYDVWIRTEDGLFLKGGVGGYMQTWYELVALKDWG